MKIKNWRAFQHYKHRSPPWIRLHRTLLDDIDWHKLDGDAAKALVMLWLIASENEGMLPPIEEVAFRLRISEKQANSIATQLSHWMEQDASIVLADDKQNSSQSRDRVETEADSSEAEVCASAPKKQKACRLPEEWSPDLEGYRLAIELLGSRSAAQKEFENFRDYWRAKPGAGGVKLDWPATWRVWVRNAKDRGKTNGNHRQSLSDMARDLADEARELERAAGIGGPATAVGSDRPGGKINPGLPEWGQGRK